MNLNPHQFIVTVSSQDSPVTVHRRRRAVSDLHSVQSRQTNRDVTVRCCWLARAREREDDEEGGLLHPHTNNGIE